MPAKIRQEYLKLLPKLQKIGRMVRQLCGHLPHQEDIELEINIKPFTRAQEKMQERDFKSLLELSDLVRGRLYYSKNLTSKEIVNKLGDLFKDFLIKIENKKEIDEGLLYQGVIHLDMKFGDINFELQVLPIEFKAYKEVLHHIYEILRNDNNLPDTQKHFLRKFHNKIYEKVNNQAGKNRS